MNIEQKLQQIRKVSEENEQMFLAYILLQGNRFTEILEQLNPDFFLNDTYRKIFIAYQDSLVNSDDPGLLLLADRELTDTYLTLLRIGSEYPPGFLFVQSRVDFIIKSQEEYQTLVFFQKFLNGDYDSDALLQNILNVKNTLYSSKNSLATLSQEFQKIKEKYQTEKMIGISTGLKTLDSMTDGIQKGHLWVVGGYTNVGKTQFVVNIARNVAKQGKKVLFFSLEMTELQIFMRMISVDAELSSISYVKGRFDPEREAKVENSVEMVQKMPIKIFSDVRTLEKILVVALREHYQSPVDLVIIDYAQLVQTKGNSEYERITMLSQTIQDFAKIRGIPFIILSQVSNEHAREPNENVIGFKGGGSIAASADIAIELVCTNTKEEIQSKQEQRQPLSVSIRVRKNRHGRRGDILSSFHTHTGKYAEENNFGELADNKNE